MEKILMFLLIVYGISVAIFGLYYNYEYAQTHGFLAWLFFGEIIATLKSFVWPLFEFIIVNFFNFNNQIFKYIIP